MVPIDCAPSDGGAVSRGWVMSCNSEMSCVDRFGGEVVEGREVVRESGAGLVGAKGQRRRNENWPFAKQIRLPKSHVF